MTHEIETILDQFEAGEITRREAMLRCATAASVAGIAALFSSTAEADPPDPGPVPAGDGDADWKHELLERLVNVRYDRATGEILGEFWPGPYGWKLHEEWLIHGTEPRPGSGDGRWPLENNSVSNPQRRRRTVHSLMGKTPNYRSGNPRDWSTAIEGESPGQANADYIADAIRSAHETGSMSAVAVPGEAIEPHMLFYLVRAQFRRRERMAGEHAIEHFADWLENHPDVQAICSSLDFPDLADEYLSNPQDPIPGGETY